MTWDRLALCVNYVLGGILVFRLLRLRLHSVYSVFCVFLIVELAEFSLFFVDAATANRLVDYRVLWMAAAVCIWIPTLWMVYALLGAMLATLPGVLRFSRRLLNFSFLAAALIAIGIAFPELSHTHVSNLDSAVSVVFVLDRAVSTSSLIALLGIIAFVSWFPVQMPRNLVLFSFGYVAYFLLDTVLTFAHGFLETKYPVALSVLNTSTLSACFLYWLLTITRDGEAIPLRVGHAWQAREQQALIQQLESMNASLARSAR